MIGLKKGYVRLESHDENWKLIAQKTIETLRMIFKDTAIDIQHIGSTAIQQIHAKPIIDIVVGVKCLEDVQTLIPSLAQKNIIYRGQDVSNQLLFVMGDSSQDIRTHHIHIVIHNGLDWNNYINFRDYLNFNPISALIYNQLKLDLAYKFPNDRDSYTTGKTGLIQQLLEESKEWKTNNLHE